MSRHNFIIYVFTECKHRILMNITTIEEGISISCTSCPNSHAILEMGPFYQLPHLDGHVGLSIYSRNGQPLSSSSGGPSSNLPTHQLKFIFLIYLYIQKNKSEPIHWLFGSRFTLVIVANQFVWDPGFHVFTLGQTIE